MTRIILFLYIFSIPLLKNISFINTTILVGIFFFIRVITNKRYLNIVRSCILNKNIIRIYICLIMVIIIGISIPTFHGSYDFSLIKTLINQLICITIGIMLASFYIEKEKKNEIIRDIILVFVFQSLIQLICLICPDINELFNYFRSDNTILIMQKYSGIRGLSVSGSSFFGLAIGYGVVFILYFYKFIYDKNISKMMKILSLILLIFGGVSSGRTALLGLGLGILVYLFDNFKNINKRKKIKFKIKKIGLLYVILICILISTIYIFSSQSGNKNNTNDIKNKIEYFKNYSLEFVYNFLESGEITTTSTSKLFENMYFEISTRTFLIGDGYYTNADGSYYLRTDAGYMRNLLYGGIIWLIVLGVYQIMFFLWRKELLSYNLAILLCILIFHIKGDVVGFSIMLQSIFILIYIYQLIQVNITLKEDRN